MTRPSTLLAVVAVTLLIGPFSAQANLVWDWTGDCNGVIIPLPPVRGGSTGCSGRATLHVVTTDAYIPGTVQTPKAFMEPAPLVEFLYSDMNVTIDLIRDAWLTSGQAFELPASSSDPIGQFDAINAFFRTNADGTWRLGAENQRPGCHVEDDPICSYGAQGFNSVWSRGAVPEPATLVLLATALAGLSFIYRRR